MTPESKLKKEVGDTLDAWGLFYRRMQSGIIRKGSRFIHLCPEGTADFVVYREKRLPEWIELKVEGQRTAKDRQAKQAAFAENVRALGHRYQVCKSVEEVREFLNTGDAAENG